MIRKYHLYQVVLGLAVFLLGVTAQAAQVEVAGKHTRSDGSIYDFEVVDGDALSPGDRFQIIINADKATYYAILYFSRDGGAAQIFPPAGKTGKISSGARQYVPGVDNYFTLDVNGGRELMFVVTSPNGLSNLKSVLRGVESAGNSPAAIHAYLQKRLPQAVKLEITNTGKPIASSTDSISSSLVRDYSAIYAKNPWPDTAASEQYGQGRVRRGDDNSIPEAVRRRATEVRSLLKRPKGTSDSSSLRTVQVSPSRPSAPVTGDIRRDQTATLRAQKEKRAEEARIRQQKLAEEERQRQQEIEAAKLARQQAEEEASRLRAEREVAERLEAERIAEAERQDMELEAKRVAMLEAEAEAERQAALRAEEERQRAEQKRLQAEQQAKRLAEAEARRLQEEKAEAERLEAERIALERAKKEQQRLAMEKAEAEKIKAAEEEAARLQAAAKRRAEEEARRKEEERLAAELARQEEERRLAEQAAAQAAAEREAKRLAAEEAARLEAERRALAEAEAEAIKREEERLQAEAQRQERQRAEDEAKRLAELRAKEAADKQAEEARRQAEIAAEDERLRAEQAALEEKLRQQQLAEEQQAAAGSKESKGLFGKVLAFVGGEDKQQPDEVDAEVKTDDRAVVEVDSTGEVVLNEGTATTAPVEFDNSAAAAPKAAVVVLQAPVRPVEKRLSAPAPERITVENAGETAIETSPGSHSQVASAIVSIRTSNDPQAAGFILDSKGHILTGWHVINGVSDIDVSFMAVAGAPRSYKAKVVKYDKFHDLALLKLVNPPEGIQPITVSSSELPDAGSTVRVFGQKDGQLWSTNDAAITRIAPHFTWFSRDNVIHRGEVLQIDLPPEGKDIGSLVTTMDYQMLGIKSFSGSQTGRTYAVSVRMIRDFVASRGSVTAKSDAN
ncbi:MAG: trypsin-like peptidase domain-containing protein [Gammaproteobacteria bacterium]|nr:trypsin-like peptidase domain-containing protein [Gammaproteobacteria bacterium]